MAPALLMGETHMSTVVTSDKPGRPCSIRLARVVAWVSALAFFLGATGPILAQGVTLGWERNTETNLSSYIVRYGVTRGSSYTGQVSVASSSTNATVNNLVQGQTYYFIVTARNSVGIESDPSNEVNHSMPRTGTNRQPVAVAANVSATEDTPRAITLTGTDADGDPLAYTVVTSPLQGALSGTAPNLTYTPNPNYFGTDSFTFRVNDGLTNSAPATVSITVGAVNDAPTLNAIGNLTLASNAGPQTVSLSGITSGAANENQTLSVTATSSNPSLVPNPSVTYSSPATTGSLRLTPAAGGSGYATITVTVNDGQSQNNTVTRTFTVAVGTPPNLTLFMEAEAGTLGSPMQLASDASASNGQYVYTSTTDSGTLGLSLNITQPGDYWVWCRILSVDGTSDSFYVTVDGGTEDIYDTTTQYSPNWQWARLSGRTAGGNRVLNFGIGTHTLTFRGREISTKFDALYVTSDTNFVPTTTTPNVAPTLNSIANLTLNESAGPQTVSLSGISSGAANESQTLTMTASSSNTGLIPNPTVSYTSPNATGSLSFTPVAAASGTATITVTVNDGQAQNNTATRTFTVTVNAVNDVPTLNSIANVTVNEDAGPQTVSLSGITSGAANENQTLTVTASSSNTGLIPNPTVTYTSPNTTGSLSFTPKPDANGSATVTVTVNDGQSANNLITRTFTVTVNAVNDAPTLSHIANQTINENGATAALPFTVSDVETPAGNLSVSGSSSNPSLVPPGNIVFGGSGANRTVTVTPATTVFGTATITIQVSDGSGGAASDSFTLNVTGVNQAPTLDPVANLTINEDAGPQTVNLTGISSGAANELQVLTVTATSSNPALIPAPTVTYASPNSTGSLSFTPVPNANGTASITVTVNDGQSQNNTVSRAFTVTVNSQNDPPTLSSIPTQTISQNTASGLIPFTVGDPETAASALTVTADSSNPTLLPLRGITLGGSGASRTIKLTPALNQFGSTYVTVTVSDPDGGMASDSFLLVVNTVNMPPTLDPLADLTLTEDAGAQTVNLTGLGSGSANESQTLVVTASSSNPTVVPNPSVVYASPNASGSLTFTPAPNANGSALITVSVNDGQSQNNLTTRSFLVTVNPVNDAPTLNALANVTLPQNSAQHSVALSGIGSGAANENQTLTITATSSNPSLIPTPTITYFSPNSTGTLNLSPAPGASGTATITVTVDDGESQNHTVVRVFTVTVSGANNPPRITDIADISIPMNGVASPINFVIGDAETDAQSLVVVATSSNGDLVWTNNITISGIGSNRVASIRTTVGQSGFSIITFTVYDTGGASASDSFVLTAVPLNAAPTLDAIPSMILPEDPGPQTINLTGITSGSASENQSLVVSAVSSTPGVIPHPTVNYTSPNTTGTLTLQPLPNVTGSATIIVTVNDGQSENNVVTRTFGVLVNAVNDAPTISAIPNQIVEQNLPTPVISFTIGDAETPATSLIVSASSSDTTLVPNGNILLGGSGANRTVQVTPAPLQSGTATITIHVNDGALTASSSFNVSVGAGNTPPAIVAPAALATDSYTPITNVAITVTDLETRPSDLVLSVISYNQTVVPGTNIVFGGSGSNRTMTIKPVPGKSGSVTLSLGVSDGRTITRSLCTLDVALGVAPKGKLNVRKKGGGRLEPALAGLDLTLGASYKVTAIPEDGQIFIGWGGSITSTTPSITFIMSTNFSLDCIFTNSPYPGLQGAYNGLFYEAAGVRPQASGNFTLTPTAKGAYTGKLKLGNSTYSMVGQVTLACRATNVITRKSAPPLRIELDFSMRTNQVVGRVTDGTWEAPLLGDRKVYDALVNPAPFAGHYTIILPGSDDPDLGPQGDGSASLKIDQSGLITLAGTLADGTKITQKVPAAAGGQWPLYLSLYGGTGSVLSWLTMTNRAGDDANGLVSWVKASSATSKLYSGGFTNECLAIGSLFTPSPKGSQRVLNLSQADITFAGGDLAAEFTNQLLFDPVGKISNMSFNKLSMTINPASGLITGTVLDPGSAKTLKFSGAVFQKQNGGSGFLLGPTQSARFVLGQ